MNYVIYGNTIWRILFVLAVFLILFFGAKIILKNLNKYLDEKNTKGNKFFSLLKSISKLPFIFWVFVILFLVSKLLILPDKVITVINAIFLLVVIYGVAKILVKLSGYLVAKTLQGNKAGQRSLEIIVNIVVWVLGILIFLTNIGINLTPLVASLGVASIAVAFALQNILSDLFASFSILFAKPFIIGDFIEMGDISGTVKTITLKSTILTNISGQDVIIPNSTILTSNVINYGKSKYRGQRVTIGVTYSTSIKYLKEIPEIIKNVITKVQDTEFERCYFKKMNDYSLDFLCSYKCLTPDFQKTLEINEKINLGIFEEFNKRGIEFAYPSQTIYNIKG